MDDHADETGTHDPPERPAYRVPVGLPLRGEGRRQGAVISVLLHILIIALIILPVFYGRELIMPIEQGAGGAGPAGGGGGGRSGTDGPRESLRYVRVAPDPVPTPTTLPPIVPPVQPKVQQPLPQPVPPPQPAAKAPDTVEPPVTQVASTGTGTGAGTGRDGTNGNGPGTGGGVGSGTGTGRGSGNGPGTGGGTQPNYPPSPKEFFLPPLPPPSNVKGFKFIAEFDVDSTGRVLDYHFTETPSGDYNRRLASVLKSMRFNPGTRPDGTPVRMKAQVGYEF